MALASPSSSSAARFKYDPDDAPIGLGFTPAYNVTKLVAGLDTAGIDTTFAPPRTLLFNDYTK